MVVMRCDSMEKKYSVYLGQMMLRLYRPGKECCRDEVAVGLEEEIIQLRKTKASLETKLNLAKATYNSLEEQLVIVDRELFNKNHALTTDLRCLDLRNRLSRGKDRKPPDTQTDRNIELTKMQDEIPPEN